jgi:hypothetical protein
MIDVIVILFIIGIMFLCLNVIISNLVQNAIDKNLVNSKVMKRYKIFNKITYVGMILDLIVFIIYMIHYGNT